MSGILAAVSGAIDVAGYHSRLPAKALIRKEYEMAVDVGDRAPSFVATADDGRQVSLDDYRGQTLVLYFFPRADTAG